jgi:hypothetical protein
MPGTMAEPLDPSEIAGSAHWLAQAYDPGSDMIRFVAMTSDDYRDASFLDDRMFQIWRDVRLSPRSVVAETIGSAARDDARWIFHIGHVGSTLVARMLGEISALLSLREPRILRDLAMIDGDARNGLAPVVRKLCSRTFADSEAALVKATSFVSEIAPMLVPSDGRALFMHVGARSYIETILAGENSVKELQALRNHRATRVAARLPQLDAPDDAHLAAIAWACEMTALEAAEDAMSDRNILWLDFDRFLGDPAAQLAQVAVHLAVPLGMDEARRIASGPLIKRYSKALEYDYSPALRQELQAEARHLHGSAIDSALNMLAEAASSSPILARALARAAGRE